MSRSESEVAELWVGDVMAGDVEGHLAGRTVDAVYTDPPWNAGVAKMFRKWAGLPVDKVDLPALASRTGEALARACPDGPWYVECGAGWKVWAAGLMEHSRSAISVIPWYWHGVKPVPDKRHPYHILCANGAPALEEGFGDAGPQIMLELQALGAKTVLDPFVGRGKMVRQGIEAGLFVFGMELNPKRLAEARLVCTETLKARGT